DEGEQSDTREHGIEALGGDTYRREGPVTVQTADLGVGSYLDASISLDPVDEVARHAGGQVVAADDDGDGAAGCRQEQGGLTGRVAPACDHDRGSGTEAGFHLGGRGVHPVALEVCETGSIESPVAGRAAADVGAPADHGAVGK